MEDADQPFPRDQAAQATIQLDTHIGGSGSLSGGQVR
jgi:hypothetical protein